MIFKNNVSGLLCADGERTYYYEQNYTNLLLDMKCMILFYRQEESFVVKWSMVNVNSLILFYFQWEQRYMLSNFGVCDLLS